jgi:hypothetical protein
VVAGGMAAPGRAGVRLQPGGGLVAVAECVRDDGGRHPEYAARGALPGTGWDLPEFRHGARTHPGRSPGADCCC